MDCEGIEQLDEFVSIFLHGNAAERIHFAQWRVAKAAQVGRNNARNFGQCADLVAPHCVVEWETVNEQDGGAVTTVDVSNLAMSEKLLKHEEVKGLNRATRTLSWI